MPNWCYTVVPLVAVTCALAIIVGLIMRLLAVSVIKSRRLLSRAKSVLVVAGVWLAISLVVIVGWGGVKNIFVTVSMLGLNPSKMNGDKAVSYRSGIDTFAIFGGLFSFSHKYVPDDMEAGKVEEVGYIVYFNNSYHKVGSYGNVGVAYVREVEVSISDGRSIIAKRAFPGGTPPSSSGGDAWGRYPSEEIIEEWVFSQIGRETV
jgi:hypothetical protein